MLESGPGIAHAGRGSFLGSSEAARLVRKQIRRAARVDSPVLIQGESGVGKELVAQGIHARSNRRDGPIMAINCAAIPDSLFESELFGHQAGSFTGASRERRGALALADGGTFFLDEVGDLSPVAQPKLLRAIESREVLPIGCEAAAGVDFRVISATNHDLDAMTSDGRFRIDLLFRLNVIKINVPPLRERIDDIPELVRHFAGTVAARNDRSVAQIDDSALDALRSHSWPGNVRELSAVVERALAMSSAMILDSSCIDLDPGANSTDSASMIWNRDWNSAKTTFEIAYVRALLKKHRGSVCKAARAAHIAPRSLYKILRRLGLADNERQAPSNRH